MKLIVITTPRFFQGEELILTRLLKEGLEHLHIRKPGCDSEALAALIKNIPAKYYPRIVLHDHFEIALELNLGGIHLNSRNKEIPAGFNGSISRSCHSLQEIQDMSESETYNYIFLSPICPSISKEGYGSGFPMEVLTEASAKSIINKKIIALGGMDQTTIPAIKPLNFGGVAVLGGLWGKNPSTDNTETIIKQYIKLVQL